MFRHSWPLLLALATLPLAALAPPPDPATRAYRGGALLVTDPGTAPGHLAPGQVLPIRLARLAPERNAAGPDFEGGEDPASVRYGQLEFLQVGPGQVRFRVVLGRAPARTLTLALGEGADLDGCGQLDVVLEPSVRPLRALTYARLAFRCDREHTALFALDPAGFPGGRYPYGISGITPAGSFIFQSDHLPFRPGAPGTARLRAGRDLPVAPQAGDVLVDAGSGRLHPIDRVRRDERGWDIRYGRAETPFLFQEVFGAAFIHVRGAGARPLADLVRFDSTQTLMDNPYGRLDLQASGHLDAGLDLTATLTWHGMAAQLDAHLDETLRLAADYRADRPWRQDFGTWTLADPKLAFPVCGVPMSMSLRVSCGLVVDGDYTGRAFEGLRSTGHWRWTARMASHWSWHGVRVEAPPPVAEHSFVLEGLPENHAEMTGKADVRPWVAVAPTFGVADVLFGEFPLTLNLEGALEGHGPGGGIDAQLRARCQLAVGLKLKVPVLGKLWSEKWPLYEWYGAIGAPVRLPALLEDTQP